MNDYDKAVMKFLWLSAVHFATELRAVPARPLPARALPAEHPLRRGGLGGTGSAAARVMASGGDADASARPAAWLHGPLDAATGNGERALAQRGDERVLRLERGNDRRRTAALLSNDIKPAARTNPPAGGLPLVSKAAPRSVARQSRQKHLFDLSGPWT